MRNFHMVVLERFKEGSEEFATEPYEAGWATEALFFIRLHELRGQNPSIYARVQISADGIEWVNHGAVFPEISVPGNYYLDVDRFGGWLRLVCDTKGIDCAYKITVQLSLKE